MRVAIYIRRSTDDEHQPYSLDAQLTRLHAYVTSQPGWAITATFRDDASGATTNRPGLRAAHAGRFDLLLVYRLDRFTRRIRDLADLIDDLDQAGVHFRSATEPFDTSTPAGRMMVQMLAVFAEFERGILIDRVISGMERKAAKGQWTGGTRPYGYLVDPDTSLLLPHPTEAPVLRQLFTLYVDTRAGTRAIATTLNERGVRNRSGKPWSGHTIARILANRVYLGELIYREVTVPDAHEPLVDPDLFEEAQRIMTTRGEAHSQRAASNSDYNLTGLITCPDCGHKYVGTSAHGRNRQYRYYTCFSRSRYGPAGCTAGRLDADTVDNAILTALIDFYARVDLIAAAIDASHHERLSGRSQRRDELAALEKDIATTEAALDRYLTAFENGTLDEATCGPRVRDLAAKAKQLKGRRDEITDDLDERPTPPDETVIDQIRRALDHVLRSGTAGQRKAIIETHIAEIKIRDGMIIPVFKLPRMAAASAGKDNGGTTEPRPVRTMGQLVGRAGLEPATEGL